MSKWEHIWQTTCSCVCGRREAHRALSLICFVLQQDLSQLLTTKMYNLVVWEICLLLPNSSRHCPTQQAQWPPCDEMFPCAACSDGRRWLLEALLPPWIPEIPNPQVVLWIVTTTSVCFKEFACSICSLCQPVLHNCQEDTEVNKGCAVVFSLGTFLSGCSKATGPVQLGKMGLGFLEMLVSYIACFQSLNNCTKPYKYLDVLKNKLNSTLSWNSLVSAANCGLFNVEVILTSNKEGSCKSCSRIKMVRVVIGRLILF